MKKYRNTKKEKQKVKEKGKIKKINLKGKRKK